MPRKACTPPACLHMILQSHHESSLLFSLPCFMCRARHRPACAPSLALARACVLSSMRAHALLLAPCEARQAAVTASQPRALTEGVPVRPPGPSSIVASLLRAPVTVAIAACAIVRVAMRMRVALIVALALSIVPSVVTVVAHSPLV